MLDGLKERSIKVRYTNHRGETAIRTIFPFRVRRGSQPPWHKEEQFLLDCFDIDKEENRTYALKDCDFVNVGKEVGANV